MGSSSSETSVGQIESVSALMVSAPANQLQDFHTTTPANYLLAIKGDVAFNISEETFLHPNGYGYYILALKVDS